MRGKPEGKPEVGVDERNIPAYAGKTAAGQQERAKAAEHPRVCGENWCHGRRVAVTIGTSPRMRGKPTAPVRLVLSRRNIPAYAGKTVTLMGDVITPPEHPRVCGENAIIALVYAVAHGTSPRMRGKHSGVLTQTLLKGNIPAYAGKTSSANCEQPHHSEHPRVCGENVR